MHSRFYTHPPRSTRLSSTGRPRLRSSWACASIAAAMLSASACSDDGPAGDTPATAESEGVDHLAEAAACGAEGQEPCDVLAAECQTRLAEIAACQWGGPGTAPVLPPVVVLTRAMVREQLAAQVAATDTPPAAVTAARAVLVMLGLQQPEFDTDAAVDVTANLLLAQYDPATMLDNPNADVRTADAQVVVTLMAEGTTPEWLFGPLMAR